jgi:hypothetical protein
MSSIWIAHTRPSDASVADDHLAFLNSTHRDELLQAIPEVTSYVTYRETLADGGVRFLSVGRADTLTAAELGARIGAAHADLSPMPFVSFEEGEAPFLLFADEA